MIKTIVLTDAYSKNCKQVIIIIISFRNGNKMVPLQMVGANTTVRPPKHSHVDNIFLGIFVSSKCYKTNENK